MTRDRALDTRRLDVAACARQGCRLEGQQPQSALARLSDSLMSLPGDAMPPPVDWSVQGQARPVAGGSPELWLNLQAQSRVTLQCQRCLEPMAVPLQIDRWFRFVATEEEAAQLDEDNEDDVLVLSKTFDVAELLEDELILALPLVPRHGVCPEPLVGGDGAVEALHPFAGLAALRRRPPSD